MERKKDIAKKLGISNGYLSLLISGERQISWNLAERLSNILHGKDIVELKNSKFRDVINELCAEEYDANSN